MARKRADLYALFRVNSWSLFQSWPVPTTQVQGHFNKAISEDEIACLQEDPGLARGYLSDGLDASKAGKQVYCPCVRLLNGDWNLKNNNLKSDLFVPKFKLLLLWQLNIELVIISV
jgi:hypothetical protein